MKHTDRSAFDPAPDSPVAPLVPGVVTALTMTVAFGLLAAGFEFFWVAFVVGFGGIMPIAVGLAKHAESERDSGENAQRDDALSALRRRYARGELTDAEFERRLERLLETESTRDGHAVADDARTSRRPVSQRRSE